MTGSVKISRSIFDSEGFRDEPLTEREAWIWMVMEASFKDRKVRVGDFVVNTKRGELSASVRYMGKAWKWTAPKAQRYLKRLEKLEMISLKTDTGVSVISICNYEKYQGGKKGADTGPIQDRYRTDTNNSRNNDVIRMQCDASEYKYSSASSADAKFSQSNFDELLKACRINIDGHIPEPWGRGGLDRAKAWVKLGLTPEQIIATAKEHTDRHDSQTFSPQGLDKAMDRALAKPAASKKPSHEEILQFIADSINGEGYVAASQIAPSVGREIIALGLVTPERMAERGVRV